MEKRQISKKALIKAYQTKEMKAVLEEFGISNGTLYRMLKEWGIPTKIKSSPKTPVDWID